MKWPAVIGMLAVVALAWGVLGLRAGPAVEQPIAFPHKTHIELNLQCTSCHDRAEKEAVAGRPRTALCLSCHGGGGAQGRDQEGSGLREDRGDPLEARVAVASSRLLPAPHPRRRRRGEVPDLPRPDGDSRPPAGAPVENAHDERLPRMPRGAGAAGREDGGPGSGEGSASPLHRLQRLPSLRRDR